MSSRISASARDTARFITALDDSTDNSASTTGRLPAISRRTSSSTPARSLSDNSTRPASGGRNTIAVSISTLSSPSTRSRENSVSASALLSTSLNCPYSLLRQSFPNNLPLTSRA